jgi:hypothetical protein
MDNTASGFPGTKWQSTQSTLSSVVTNLDTEASFGLMMFPAVGGAVCSSGALEVTMRQGAATAIVDAMFAADAIGATPTAASLREAKTILDGLPAAGGTRAVVLTTDGGPNCNLSLDGSTCRCTPGTSGCGPNNPTGPRATPAPANCVDDDSAADATRALNDAGYAVFVVGIPGINGFEDVMNRLADVGGTARAGATRYYDATSADALAQSIEDAALRISTCRFDLSAPVASSADVSVRIGGQVIANNPGRTTGWDLVDSDTVELFGNTCTDGANAAGGVVINACR